MKLGNNKTIQRDFFRLLLIFGLVGRIHGADQTSDAEKKAAQAQNAINWDLCVVAQLNDPNKIRLLVKAGAQINALEGGNRPLVNAADYSQADNVLELLRLGADPALRSHVKEDGPDFYHYMGPGVREYNRLVNLRAYDRYCRELEAAVEEPLKHVPKDIVELIVAYLPDNCRVARTKKLNNELFKPNGKADPAVLQSLLQQKANPNCHQFLDIPCKMTPVQVAWMRGDIEAAQTLLNGKANPGLPVVFHNFTQPFVQILLSRQLFADSACISTLWEDCAVKNDDDTYGQRFFLYQQDGVNVPEATEKEKKRVQEIIDFMKKNIAELHPVNRVFIQQYLEPKQNAQT